MPKERNGKELPEKFKLSTVLTIAYLTIDDDLFEIGKHGAFKIQSVRACQIYIFYFAASDNKNSKKYSKSDLLLLFSV